MKQTNLQDNLRKKFKKQGVKMIAPETVFFSKDTKIGKNVTKDTKIGKNVSIDPYVVIGKKVKIQNNVKIFSFSHIENVKIENNVNVGPYARLRPGTILKSGSKIGNFVEVKKSKVGKRSKVSHLSYIGDTNLRTDLFLKKRHYVQKIEPQVAFYSGIRLAHQNGGFRVIPSSIFEKNITNFWFIKCSKNQEFFPILPFLISTKFPTLDPDLKTVPGRSLAKGPILTLFSILTFSRCENDIIFTLLKIFTFSPITT